MATMKQTLNAYNYYMQEVYNQDFFENLTLPTHATYTAEFREALINNILWKTGDEEILYADPFYMAESFATWSAKWARTFLKWAEALAVDYDPLNNYDRTETETTSGTKESTNEVSKSGSTSGSGTDTHTGSASGTSQTSGTSTNYVTTYDSNGENENDRTANTGSGSTSTTDTATDTRQESGTSTETTNGSATDETTGTRNLRAYGNIGVTTSQEMLKAEIDISRFNLIDEITDIFIAEYIILVY